MVAGTAAVQWCMMLDQTMHIVLYIAFQTCRFVWISDEGVWPALR